MMLLHKHSPTDLTEGCPACKAQIDRITDLEQQVARLTEDRDALNRDNEEKALDHIAERRHLQGAVTRLERERNEARESLAAKDEALREICTLARGNPGTYAIKVVRDIEELARAALSTEGEP